jgi:transcription elongation factor Elf1
MVRYTCYFCGKSVSSVLPDESVIRAMLVCPECIERGVITIPERKTEDAVEEEIGK